MATLRAYLNTKIKEKGSTLAKEKAKAGKYKSIAAAKKAGALYYTNKEGKIMAAVYAEDLKKPLKPIKPQARPGSGNIKVEVLVGSMTKSEVADAIKKGKNPMNLAKAAKKKKPITNKNGKPMSFSGKSRGGVAKRKARR